MPDGVTYGGFRKGCHEQFRNMLIIGILSPAEPSFPVQVSSPYRHADAPVPGSFPRKVVILNSDWYVSLATETLPA